MKSFSKLSNALKASRTASKILARTATSNSIHKLTGSFSSTAQNSRPLAATFVSQDMDMHSTTEHHTPRADTQNTPEYEKQLREKALVWKNPMQNMRWSAEQTGAVAIQHRTPKDLADKSALFAVKAARTMYDFASRYKKADINEQTILNRAIFLETIAGVPGMCAGMVRHLNSLRTMV